MSEIMGEGKRGAIGVFLWATDSIVCRKTHAVNSHLVAVNDSSGVGPLRLTNVTVLPLDGS